MLHAAEVQLRFVEAISTASQKRDPSGARLLPFGRRTVINVPAIHLGLRAVGTRAWPGHASFFRDDVPRGVPKHLLPLTRISALDPDIDSACVVPPASISRWEPSRSCPFRTQRTRARPDRA